MLQQFDRYVVRRAHECHAAIARRPVDRYTVIKQTLTGRVNVIHCIGKMAEVSTALQYLGIVVIGQFDLRRVIARGCQENEGETATWIVYPSEFGQAKLVAVEIDRRFQVRHANHRVEVLHGLDQFGTKAGG